MSGVISRRRRRRTYVVYPEYFDRILSRKQGRRIPLEMTSPERTTHKKLVHACTSLQKSGFIPGFQEQKDKAHPIRWWEKNGRVLITIDRENKVPKQTILLELAKIIKRLKTVNKEKKTDKQIRKEKYGVKSTHSKKKSAYAINKKKKKKKKNN